jgi:hypothetical protein
MSQRLFLIIVLLLFSLTGCSEDPSKPENLIDEDKYTDLLIELQLIQSYGENAETDSATIDSLTSEVFQEYNVSSESFLKSHKYYEHFPQQQKVRIENAIERLKMDKVEDTDTPRDTLPIN